ncbi:MAG: tetratricopeptide repeat protein [bacterium]
MKNLFFSFALLLFLRIPAASQVIITANTDSLIQIGIRLSILQSYDEAEAIFTKIEMKMPESPVGYFFHAASLQLKMMDFEIYDEDSKFLSLINKTIKLSQIQLKKQPKDAWAYFFLGGGFGYLAFYQAKHKKIVEAFQNSNRSVKALEAALIIDSTLYDAYLGVGTYKYYRSKLSRYLTWLPFVRDERAKGIKMIKTSIQKSQYSRYAALNGYCWISIAEGNINESWQLVKSALEEVPESRVFLWCAAEIAVKLNRWEEALAFYMKILDSLKNQNVLSPYNEFECRRRMAQIYFQIMNFKKAQEECDKIINIKMNKKTQERLANKLKNLQNVCNEHSQKSLNHSTN